MFLHLVFHRLRVHAASHDLLQFRHNGGVGLRESHDLADGPGCDSLLLNKSVAQVEMLRQPAEANLCCWG